MIKVILTSRANARRKERAAPETADETIDANATNRGE